MKLPEAVVLVGGGQAQLGANFSVREKEDFFSYLLNRRNSRKCV